MSVLMQALAETRARRDVESRAGQSLAAARAAAGLSPVDAAPVEGPRHASVAQVAAALDMLASAALPTGKPATPGPDVRPVVRRKGAAPEAPKVVKASASAECHEPSVRPIPGGRYVRERGETASRPVNAGWSAPAWTPSKVREANTETRAAIDAAHTRRPCVQAHRTRRPGSGGGQTVAQTRVYFSRGLASSRPRAGNPSTTIRRIVDTPSRSRPMTRAP